MKPEKVYACYSKDKDVRLSSSSGAVFSSLAEYVLNKNGIIYGVAMASPQTWVLAMKNPRILRGLRRFYRNDQDH